ncbi:15289_t:CDS:1, partial [Acaulospora morrowiae]
PLSIATSVEQVPLSSSETQPPLPTLPSIQDANSSSYSSSNSSPQGAPSDDTTPSDESGDGTSFNSPLLRTGTVMNDKRGLSLRSSVRINKVLTPDSTDNDKTSVLVDKNSSRRGKIPDIWSTGATYRTTSPVEEKDNKDEGEIRGGSIRLFANSKFDDESD